MYVLLFISRPAEGRWLSWLEHTVGGESPCTKGGEWTILTPKILDPESLESEAFTAAHFPGMSHTALQGWIKFLAISRFDQSFLTRSL